MANLRHRARQVTAALSWLLLILLLVALGAWLYERFEASSDAPASAARQHTPGDAPRQSILSRTPVYNPSLPRWTTP